MMIEKKHESVAVIGAGLIGRAWAIVFARAGYLVRLYDMDDVTLEGSIAYIEERLNELDGFGLIRDKTEDILSRISCVKSLEDALRDVVLVQENILETLVAKSAIFAQLDALAPQNAVLASSTSWIPASKFTETLAGRGRCLVGHPVNPPYLIPLVEICPSPWTDSKAVERAHEIYTSAGQSPVTLTREIDGFLLNRVQAAVLNECFKLFERGLASTEDIDKVLKDGLALRWSFMGPFETIDLNAPLGIPDYANRYGAQNLQAFVGDEPFDWNEETIQNANTERRKKLSVTDIGDRSAWRDRRLMALASHKKQAPAA